MVMRNHSMPSHSPLVDYMTDPVFLSFLIVIIVGFVYLYRLPLRVQQVTCDV